MAGPIRYAFKASLIGPAHQFELAHDGLSFRAGGRAGVWAYADIAAVRLSFRPVSMQARRFRCDLTHAGGARLILLSTSWQTAALMAPQDRDYRVFVRALHERMAQAGSRAVLAGGLGRNAYAAGLTLLALVAIGMAGLLLRAIWTGELAGALFLLGFAALLGSQVGGFVRRNRPQTYAFDEIPDALLP
ncbi:MAG: hypothetical protein JOY90_30075 [Bradyrhizobium sp.]|uniref:hypothetical protein n=1 Tax=Bradyrhizobium sp. TaxID=376 RepID=UPI001DFFD2CE|nr:hypothetical protein [Bradyrhizobium sp.]MBV9564660.1 hypothetical protein [Bradyrhizobium sp.]